MDKFKVVPSAVPIKFIKATDVAFIGTENECQTWVEEHGDYDYTYIPCIENLLKRD